MKTIRIPNGWYCDALPSGEYVAQVKSGIDGVTPRLVTPRGLVPMPPGQTQVLFLRIHPSGLGFAGVGQQGDLAWVWDGAGWTSNGLAWGANPVIFRADGTIVVAHDGSVTGSQGWRYVADDGSLVTGDSAYADKARDIYEFTTRGDVTIGQTSVDAEGCMALVAGRRVQLEKGWCRNARFNRNADGSCSVALMKQTESVLVWFTRQELNALPTYARPVQVPSVTAINRPCWLGYFFGPHSDRYGDAPVPVPHNIEVVTERGVLARTDGPIIISHTDDAAMIASAKPYWDRVAAVYVAVEGNAAGVESAAQAARAAMRASGVPTRPVVSYSGASSIGAAAPSVDWVGVQCYLDYVPGRTVAQTVAAMAALIRTQLSAVPAGRRAALIAQSYDRNGTWTDSASLVAIQQCYADAAAADARVVAVLLFSDGRPGGARAYPALYDAHRAMLSGIKGVPPIGATGGGFAVLEILNVVTPDTMRVGVPTRVLFDVRSDAPVISTSVDLVGDDQDGWTLRSDDARLSAGVVVRPRRAGRFDLRISATVAGGQTARTGLTRWVTVLP